MNRPNWPLVALAAALLVPGCGSSNAARVTGTVVKDGKPFPVAEGQWLQIHLVPVDADPTKSETYLANLAKDGTFDFPGKEGSGVPPGKYKVTARLVTYKNRDKDLLNDVFSETNSQVVKEVTGSTSITLDLSAAK